MEIDLEENPMKKRIITSIVLSVSLIFILFNCNPDNGGGDDIIDPPAQMVGTIAFGDKSGIITLHFSSQNSSSFTRAIHNVSGTITYDGVNLDVSGSYDDSNGNLEVSASGTIGSDSVVFTITGTYSEDSGFNGTITRQINGNPPESGSISTLPSDDTELPEYYLGTYGSGTSNDDMGQFNMVILNSSVMGTFANNGGTNYGHFTGTRNGSNVNIPEILGYDDTSTEGTAIGTISGTSISGSWSSDTESGLWAGTLQ
jgi:hypothetical protein